MAQLLTTLEDFASVRAGDFDPTDLQAIIALEAASAAIRTYLGQLLDDTVADEIALDGTGTDAMLLPERPVNVLTSVTDDTGELTEGTDYRLEPSGILRRLNGVWTRGWGNYAIVYDHGWVLPGQDALEGSVASHLPADIQAATRALALISLTAQESGGAQFQSVSLGAFSATYDTSQDAQTTVKPLLGSLASYRNAGIR